jgi:poly [ADP-ribose] polymerase 9
LAEKPELQRAIRINDVRIMIMRGNITTFQTDVVINAMTGTLQNAGGMSARVMKAAGSNVEKETKSYVQRHGYLAAGDIAVTSAGDMPCEMLIHVIAPIYRNHGDEEALLREAL